MVPGFKCLETTARTDLPRVFPLSLQQLWPPDYQLQTPTPQTQHHGSTNTKPNYYNNVWVYVPPAKVYKSAYDKPLYF